MTGPLLIEPVGRAASDVLALLHRCCLAEPWGRDAIASLIALPGSLALIALLGPAPVGFAMARLAADKAEILSFGVIPADRRQGVGTVLLQATVARAARHGATAILLEVDAANSAARRLYGGCDFVAVARRPNYYRRAGGPGRPALVLRRNLIGQPDSQCPATPQLR